MYLCLASVPKLDSVIAPFYYRSCAIPTFHRRRWILSMSCMAWIDRLNESAEGGRESSSLARTATGTGALGYVSRPSRWSASSASQPPCTNVVSGDGDACCSFRQPNCHCQSVAPPIDRLKVCFCFGLIVSVEGVGMLRTGNGNRSYLLFPFPVRM